MSALDRSKPPRTIPLDEDHAERGLRVLGKIIARRLVERRESGEAKMCRKKTGDSPTSMDNP